MYEDGDEDRFRPLRPASRAKLIAAFVFGPVVWIVAFAVVSVLLDYTYAIQLGLLVTVVSCVVSAVALALVRQGRLREERRYADRA